MPSIHFSREEQDCIRQLAEWYEIQQPNSFFTVEMLAKCLGTSVDAARILIGKMESLGIVNEVYRNCGIICTFGIRFDAVTVHRQVVEKANERDIVSDAESWVRRHPWTAWPLICFTILGLLLTFLNQTIELIKKLDWIGNK